MACLSVARDHVILLRNRESFGSFLSILSVAKGHVTIIKNREHGLVYYVAGGLLEATLLSKETVRGLVIIMPRHRWMTITIMFA